MSVPLAGKTLGILGLGAIGQELARKAAALEMRVIGTKRTPKPLAHVDKVYAPEDTDEVLGASDFVALLLPSTPETENFINANRLRAMKPTAWLLNFGRGALIVDDDLIAAVKAKTIAGAVLDVFREGAAARDASVLADRRHPGAAASRRRSSRAQCSGGRALRGQRAAISRRRAARAAVDRARGY